MIFDSKWVQKYHLQAGISKISHSDALKLDKCVQMTRETFPCEFMMIEMIWDDLGSVLLVRSMIFVSSGQKYQLQP